MTFQQILCVQTIARCGSISKAANVLYVAQPSLSRQIHDLEGELGITIFERSSRGVQLTEQGHHFLNYAEPILEQHNRLMDAFTGANAGRPESFNVSCLRFPYVMKAWLRVFQTMEQDSYELHFRESGLSQIIKDVENRRSDLGIVYTSDATAEFLKGTISRKGLSFTPIIRTSPRVIFRKGHPLAEKSRISLEELMPYPAVIYEEDDFVTPDYSEELLMMQSPGTKRLIYQHSRATMADIIGHTDAWCIGTGVYPSGYTGDELTSRPIDGHEGELTIGYIRYPDSPWNASLESFVTCIEEEIQLFQDAEEQQ